MLPDEALHVADSIEHVDGRDNSLVRRMDVANADQKRGGLLLWMLKRHEPHGNTGSRHRGFQISSTARLVFSGHLAEWARRMRAGTR